MLQFALFFLISLSALKRTMRRLPNCLRAPRTACPEWSNSSAATTPRTPVNSASPLTSRLRTSPNLTSQRYFTSSKA